MEVIQHHQEALMVGNSAAVDLATDVELEMFPWAGLAVEGLAPEVRSSR